MKVNGLPFNKYSWIMTHNSFSIMDAPFLNGIQRLTFYNQEDTVTNQLRVSFFALLFLNKSFVWLICFAILVINLFGECCFRME